ncbi:MAG: alkylated DNA nucleotide flippase Atl1, partial [Cellvibrionaceae bacterium]
METLNLPNEQEFYNQVWTNVRQVPYGQVATYGQIAKLIGVPEGVTAEEYKIYGSRWVG